MSEKSKVLVLGLDGANRKVILKGINNGSLPKMSEIVSEGDIDILKAPLPPTTPVSMSSILTGCNPDKHGIFGFEEVETGEYVGFDDIQTETIFEKLNQKNKSIISINTPMTSEPPQLDGKVVSGFPVKSNKLAWPPTLDRKLKDESYRIEPIDFKDNKEKFKEDVFRLARDRFKLAQDLIKDDWDVFFLTFTGDARLQHFIKDEDLIMDFYKKVDKYLEILLDSLDENIEIMVISDHGFQDLEVEFNIGKWLSKEGYIKSEQEVDWSKLYGRMNDKDEPGKVSPGGAYLGNLYTGNQETAQEVKKKLEDLKYEGENIFRDVFFTKNLYHEPEGPDLIPVPTRGFNYVAGTEEIFNENPEEMRAPDREGVILTNFDLIEEETPESVDILPTIIKILDLEHEDKLDGKAINK